MEDGCLKEIHAATGGAHGGTYVDEKYRQLLEEIMGESALSTLRDSDMGDYLEIHREFETKKRNIQTSGDGKIVTRIPVALKENLESKGENIKERIDLLNLEGRLNIIGTNWFLIMKSFGICSPNQSTQLLRSSLE